MKDNINICFKEIGWESVYWGLWLKMVTVVGCYEHC